MMTPIPEIATGLSSLNAAMGLLKGLDAAKTQAAVNEVKLDLQQRLFEAQQALMAAQEAQTTSASRIRQLEQQIVGLKDWEREKERYQLKAVDFGAFAYMHKPGMEGGEPPHWLCAHCFDSGQKGYLQARYLQATGLSVTNQGRRCILAGYLDRLIKTYEARPAKPARPPQSS